MILVIAEDTWSGNMKNCPVRYLIREKLRVFLHTKEHKPSEL
jgi:hypothetical protein